MVNDKSAAKSLGLEQRVKNLFYLTLNSLFVWAFKPDESPAADMTEVEIVLISCCH
jgi:hypothetical protein